VVPYSLELLEPALLTLLALHDGLATRVAGEPRLGVHDEDGQIGFSVIPTLEGHAVEDRGNGSGNPAV
jgi:hypothetical protein